MAVASCASCLRGSKRRPRSQTALGNALACEVYPPWRVTLRLAGHQHDQWKRWHGRTHSQRAKWLVMLL